MWLIAGLGNPGPKYERTRHNVGFRVIDELARRQSVGSFRSKHGGECATTLLGTTKALLLKPMEYMNLSGHAVQRASQYHDIEVEHIVVVHDEIDLDFGRLRLKAGGGHGGHNGLRSICDQLGSRDFLRVRVGVGKPPAVGDSGHKDKRVAGYVLSDFPSAVANDVDDLVGHAADSVEAILDRGMIAAMNDFNGVSSN
jgi:PTH1 family peptidyl-tRNA hydrolase